MAADSSGNTIHCCHCTGISGLSIYFNMYIIRNFLSAFGCFSGIISFFRLQMLFLCSIVVFFFFMLLFQMSSFPLFAYATYCNRFKNNQVSIKACKWLSVHFNTQQRDFFCNEKHENDDYVNLLFRFCCYYIQSCMSFFYFTIKMFFSSPFSSKC